MAADGKFFHVFCQKYTLSHWDILHRSTLGYKPLTYRKRLQIKVERPQNNWQKKLISHYACFTLCSRDDLFQRAATTNYTGKACSFAWIACFELTSDWCHKHHTVVLLSFISCNSSRQYNDNELLVLLLHGAQHGILLRLQYIPQLLQLPQTKLLHASSSFLSPLTHWKHQIDAVPIIKSIFVAWSICSVDWT